MPSYNFRVVFNRSVPPLIKQLATRVGKQRKTSITLTRVKCRGLLSWTRLGKKSEYLKSDRNFGGVPRWKIMGGGFTVGNLFRGPTTCSETNFYSCCSFVCVVCFSSQNYILENFFLKKKFQGAYRGDQAAFKSTQSAQQNLDGTNSNGQQTSSRSKKLIGGK